MSKRNFKDMPSIIFPQWLTERIEDLMLFEDDVYGVLDMCEWERMSGYELLEFAILYPDYEDDEIGIADDYNGMMEAIFYDYLDDWKKVKMDELSDDNPQLYKKLMTKKNRLDHIDNLLND
tara:strand:+ start:1926 stop:2288 length:363 start_codon:yes stop_codon:yes gene_type:complete